MKCVIKIMTGVKSRYGEDEYYLLRVNVNSAGSVIALRGRTDKPLELSWITNHAAALRMRLEECETPEEALVAVQDSLAKTPEGNSFYQASLWTAKNG